MKVSILTPAYNEEAHLQEMIDSVLAQTHEDWELILVDDGSTDSTLDLIRSNSALDRRIFNASPGGKLGKNRAFNTAFNASSGDVVIVVGADDTLPEDSLATRVQAASRASTSNFVAYFKFQTFSQIAKFHNQILPRGNACSRSSAGLTLSRQLADQLFPIDESLPAEDVYLGRAADYLADEVILEPVVVYNYRIHGANSNPRHQDFRTFNRSMHERQLAYRSLLSSTLSLPDTAKRDFEERARVEEWRFNGQTFRILTQARLPIIEKLALASASKAPLRKLRMALNKVVSGRRGR